MPTLPGVNHQDAVRALQKAGSWVERQGKHIVMADGVRTSTRCRCRSHREYLRSRGVKSYVARFIIARTSP